MNSAPASVPAAMAMMAHQNVRPIATTTPPSTTLNTLMLAPAQKAACCQGFPCRAPAGIMSMWCVSTYRRSCSFCTTVSFMT